MPPPKLLLWLALFACLWTHSQAGVRGLRLPVPTSETIALVAREMGAATFEESIEDQEYEQDAAESRRVIRRLSTGGQDIEDNEYQEYQGVMGRPGVDFPVLPSIPQTAFSCRSIRKPGYFADLDTDCQVFHICDGGRKISFLCPNGTIFRQSHLICDWWFRVDCGKSVEQYEESAEQLAADQRIYRDRAEAINRAMSGGGDKRVAAAAPTSTRAPEPSRDTHIDLPVFEAARQNYESRQTARRQSAQQRRPSRPQTDQNIDDDEQNRNQPRPKSIDVTRIDNIGRDDREQQVLAETASFAINRQNRFGNQFNQEQFVKENSQVQQSRIPQTTPTTLTPIRSSFTTSNTPSPITNPTSTTPQRNLRPNGRLLPTSSQNNNFRTNPSRSNSNQQGTQTQGSSITNNKPDNNLNSPRGTQTQVSSITNNKPDNNLNSPRGTQTQVSSITNNKPDNNLNSPRGNKRPQFGSSSSSSLPLPETAQHNVVRSNPLPSIQTNFARPSPDLTPPETGSRQTQINNNEPTVVRQAKAQRQQPASSAVQSTQNNQGSQVKRGRFSDAATKVQAEPTKRFMSSTSTIAPSIDPNALRRQNQKRFTSTTQKPVFTVKFRPSKSFSFIELERSQTSTAPSVSQQSSSASKFPNLLLNSQFDNTVNRISNINQQQTQPSSSTPSWQFSDSPVTQATKTQTRSTTTNAPNLNRFVTVSSSIPSSSYSPTVPEQKTKSSTPFVSNVNEDKIASFSNIDPAEINLLPSLQKSGGRSRLQIPESSGPNALHTLALYYATSESDSATTPAYTLEEGTLPPQSNGRLEEFENTHFESHHIGEKLGNQGQLASAPSTGGAVQPPLHKVSDEILLRSHSGSPDDEDEIDDSHVIIEATDTIKELPTVLTKATKDSYAFLFSNASIGGSQPGDSDDTPCCIGDDVFDLDAETEITTEKNVDIKFDIQNDLDSEQSRGIVQPTKSTKKNITTSNTNGFTDELKIRDSSDLRELAQVFSRALSAYLEDPDSFRRILSEVRPTEPTNTNTYGTTYTQEEGEDEVLDFSDASNTGPNHLNNGRTSELKQNDSFNAIDAGQINSLVQLQDNSESDFPQGLSISLVNSDNNDYYTTPTPTSLAADINLLPNELNQPNSNSLTSDNTFSSSVGENDERSGPRYGGFFNNSVTAIIANSNNEPELPENSPEQPLSNLPFVTETSFRESSVDNSDSANENKLSQSSNKIDIESIPEQLGIGPAADINSLVDNQRNCNDPTHDHTINSADNHIPPEANLNIPFQTEEEIYGREGDQEKVLVASGSQSLLSRDNYVRLLGSKQDGSKSVSDKVQIYNDQFSQTVGTSSTNQPTMKNRGAVKYGSQAVPENSPDISSFKRRPNKEVAFQNVNLGNGVTLERTKTIRYSTPEIRDDFPSVTPPAPPTEQGNFNPVSINEELGLMPEEVVATTENPFQQVGKGDTVIRATTYHPSSSRTLNIEDSIPPRGSLRDSWQWTPNPNHNDDVTTNSEVQQPTLRASEFGLSETDVSNSFNNFTSTMFPWNDTIESMGDEVLEKKAEEIFGNLNKTSADKLMDVMHQAESNMTVRRLVLLLVADPVSQEKRSFEDSRSQLIQALLKTDTSPQPTPAFPSTTERKTTVEKSDRARNRSKAPSSPPTSTTTQTSTTSRSREAKSNRFLNPTTNSVESTSRDPPQRPEAQFLRSPNLFPQNLSSSSFGTDPDARAVELLKSLYNIAARWG